MSSRFGRMACALLLTLTLAVANAAQAQWIPPGSPAMSAPAVVAEPEPAAPMPALQTQKAKPGKEQKAARVARPAEFPYPYYIEFRSRGAISYGHTFVMFGKNDSAGNMLPGEVAGLHPAGGVAEYVAGHYLPVPAETGPSDGDLEEIYISNRYRINLTAEQYPKVLAFIRHKQATSKMWHAVLNNCNGFAGEIANFMGLQAPSALLMPPNYIESLKTMNRQVSLVSLPGMAGAQAGAALN